MFCSACITYIILYLYYCSCDSYCCISCWCTISINGDGIDGGGSDFNSSYMCIISKRFVYLHVSCHGNALLSLLQLKTANLQGMKIRYFLVIGFSFVA